MELTLYAKAGCHLCEEAHAVVEQVRAELKRPTRLTVVDITTSSELMAKYREDIPVLLIDGQFAFKHRVPAEQLRTMMEAA